MREELGIEPGETVSLRVMDGELRLITVRQAIKRLQDLLDARLEPGRSLVDELIAERRAEAARE
jgi:hypothetical protein